MSKFILSSAGRTIGFGITLQKHVYACESPSHLLFQERTVTIGIYKGSVEIFTEINGTEYYLDRHHSSRAAAGSVRTPTGRVCLYKGVKGPAPKKNGRNLNQFWIKTTVEDGFNLSPVAAPHQFVCFSEDGVLHLEEDVKAEEETGEEEEGEPWPFSRPAPAPALFHANFVAEAAAAAAPVPHPEVAEPPAATLDPIVLAEQQISEREERVRILTERLAAVQVAEQQLAAMLSI